MENEIRDNSFDIRAEMFMPLLDGIQQKLENCANAIKTGVVDGGVITATIDVKTERIVENVPVIDGEAMATRREEHIRPDFDLEVKLFLKKEEKHKGKIDNDMELVFFNGQWIMMPLNRERIRKHNSGQMHVGDLEGVEAEAAKLLEAALDAEELRREKEEEPEDTTDSDEDADETEG